MLINKILLRTVKDEVENSKGTVFIIHGVAEHLGLYEELSKKINDAGYTTIRFDLRGHGQSGGKRGYVKNHKQYVDDLHELIKAYTDKKDKIFLLGISLGGLIAHLYSIKYGKINGIISAGSPIGDLKAVEKLKRYGFKLYGFLKIKMNFNDPNLVSIKQEYDFKDPLTLDYIHIALAGNMLVKGVKCLYKNIDKQNVPFLILHGEDDKIVPKKVANQYMEASKVSDKELIIYPNVFHMIYKDVLKEEAIKNTIDWMDKH